ncbi:MAG: cytochrome-c oxidase, cbb3-type subunit III [Gammaproteobacteria bacterium]|jgi:cytochrome c oxidase cbb3-type subunit 3|nr:cytochrome-c oxidase, cbb3-type subunit III [Gammaproteobacteria bacterium]MBT8075114.1 cytochrome-c oxidase, cbb3-type subunit III [Gammaproteobacteria bacterium]NNK97494.1 cytochrome-c oxidase, cbb3-type subunit III [Xanthomonadales bacterium]
MLTSFWHWYVVIITVVTILGCFWLLQWTKGVSNRDESEDGAGTTGHVWDEDLVELNNPLPRWWLQLFYITIAFAFIYLILFGGLGNIPGVLNWSQEGQYEAEMQSALEAQEEIFARYREMDNATLIADADANATGQRLFANNCAMCHGSDGRGARGFPNLTDDDWLYGRSYDMVMQAINNGRQGAMPVMVGGLDDAAISDLVVYVQSMSGQKADAAMAARGKKSFDMLCVACHGVDGSGNQALGSPRLNDDIWLYGGEPETIRTTLVEGRNGMMPAFEDVLSEDHRRLIAAYVLSLSE